jgi:RNA polymerase sigma factor (sigma-70 family)
VSRDQREVSQGTPSPVQKICRNSAPGFHTDRDYIDGMPTEPVETVQSSTPTRPSSDRELLSRFLDERDASAFSEIVQRHGGVVMAVAWRVLRDQHAAEDVFQATFLVLAQQARAIRRRESLAAWLHGTAFRVSRKSLSRRLRRKECGMPPDKLAVPAPILPVVEEQAALDEELTKLPERVRGPLILHYLQEKTAPEIAAELGLSVPAVEGRLRRGLRDLRVRLVKRGIGLSAVLAAANAVVRPAEAAISETLVASTVSACSAASVGATLPALITSEATQLAAKELFAMTKIGILKASMMWGSAAAVVAVAGVASTGTFLPSASAQFAGAGQVGEGESGAADAGSVGEDSGQTAPVDIALPGAEGGSGNVGDLGGGLGGGSPGAGAGQVGAPGTGLIGSGVGVADLDQDGQADITISGGGSSAGNLSDFDAMVSMMAGGRPGKSGRVFDYKAQNPREQKILEALEKPADFQFVGQTMEDVTKYIEEQYGLTIRPDVTKLADAGVGLDTEIQLVIRDVSLEAALELMLENVGGVELEYVIENEVLKITTAEEAESKRDTRVYDTRNLGSTPPDTLARLIRRSIHADTWMPEVEEPQTGGPSSGEGMGMGGMTGGQGGQAGAMSSSMAGMMSSMRGMYAKGQSGATRSQGGPAMRSTGTGWIEAIDGGLVITQSQPIHREIVALLEQLARHAERGPSGGSMGMGSGMGSMGMPGMSGMGGMGGRMSDMGGGMRGMMPGGRGAGAGHGGGGRGAGGGHGGGGRGAGGGHGAGSGTTGASPGQSGSGSGSYGRGGASTPQN